MLSATSGKGSIQKNVAATLQVVSDKILIDRFMPEELTHPNQPVYLHVSSVRNPNTKSRYSVSSSSITRMESYF
jgi:hypothetical protein